MLGLGYGNSITESGKFPIDLSRGIDSLYVYTDIVQTKLVGNTAVPLLRVVPVDGDYGTMVYKEYSSPVYSPLSKSTFNTIKVYNNNNDFFIRTYRKYFDSTTIHLN